MNGELGKMKKLLQDKALVCGFLVGFSMCVIINLYTIIIFGNLGTVKDNGFGFGIYTMGFPFYWYEYITNLGTGWILYLGIVADILFALIFSFAIGLIFKFVWSKISARKLK